MEVQRKRDRKLSVNNHSELKHQGKTLKDQLRRLIKQHLEALRAQAGGNLLLTLKKRRKQLKNCLKKSIKKCLTETRVCLS